MFFDRFIRRERKCEIATKLSLRKPCRKASDLRYDFGNVCLKKRKLKSSFKQPEVCESDGFGDDSRLNSYKKSKKEFRDTINKTYREVEQVIDESVNSSCNNEVECSGGTICSVNVVSAYLHQLKTYKAFAVCDDSFRSFVLQDFSAEELLLKANQYCFVSRSARQFTNGGIQWVYICSCNPGLSGLVKSLSYQINYQYSLYTENFPCCIHITAVSEINSSVDAIHCLNPCIDFADHTYDVVHFENTSMINETITLIGNNSICINCDGTYGVLFIPQSQKITCATCRYGKSSCIHVRHLQEFCSKFDHELPDVLQHYNQLLHLPHQPPEVSWKIKYVDYSCFSHSKIPFNLSNDMLKMPFKERFSITDETTSHARLLPSYITTPCCQCNETNWSNPFFSHNATIVLNNQLMEAEVFNRKCLRCQTVIHYDGQEHCLLNLNKLLFSYEVLRGFMFHFLLGQTTIYTEYCVLIKAHEDAGSLDFKEVVQYNHFRSAWYAFLNLLDTEFTEGFQCTICGIYPETLIMDATGLSFRKELGFWSTNEVMDIPNKKHLVPKGSFTKRILISDRKTRQQLTKFTKQGLSSVEMIQLKVLIHDNAPYIEPLMNCINEESASTMSTCPKKWMKFVQTISSGSPVCALIPPTTEALELIKELLACEEKIKANPESLKYLQETVPVLFEIVSDGTYSKKIVGPILEAMTKAVLAPFDFSEAINTADETKDHDPLSFFPNLPKIRSRQHYEADTDTKVHLCTKMYKRHPSLTPGIFTLFCPHGICYGFEAMRVHESPNTPFTIIYERFPQAPRFLIYDNGCNFHNYCLNREPRFFMLTRFLIDRFHWRNHTGCSWGYNLSLYPQLISLNSQVVEQANSAIKRIKSSLSYMNPKNFMAHCKLFLWYYNKEK